MKKSSMYYIAQCAVLNNEALENCNKLQILRELMSAEDLARFSEEQEAGKEQADEDI